MNSSNNDNNNNNKKGVGSNITRPACASCKHQRKGCKSNCVMAPHFPSSDMQQFQDVQQLFGLSNMVKKLRTLPFEQQTIAVNSFKWEADMWKQDPVYGPLGHCNRLDATITSLRDFIKNLQEMNNLLNQQILGSNYLHGTSNDVINGFSYTNHAQEETKTVISDDNNDYDDYYHNHTIPQEAKFQDHTPNIQERNRNNEYRAQGPRYT